MVHVAVKLNKSACSVSVLVANAAKRVAICNTQAKFCPTFDDF